MGSARPRRAGATAQVSPLCFWKAAPTSPGSKGCLAGSARPQRPGPARLPAPSGAERAGPYRTGGARGLAGVGGARGRIRTWRLQLRYFEPSSGGALNGRVGLTSGGRGAGSREPGGRAGTHVWVGLGAGSQPGRAVRRPWRRAQPGDPQADPRVRWPPRAARPSGHKDPS